MEKFLWQISFVSALMSSSFFVSLHDISQEIFIPCKKFSISIKKKWRKIAHAWKFSPWCWCVHKCKRVIQYSSYFKILNIAWMRSNSNSQGFTLRIIFVGMINELGNEKVADMSSLLKFETKNMSKFRKQAQKTSKEKPWKQWSYEWILRIDPGTNDWIISWKASLESSAKRVCFHFATSSYSTRKYFESFVRSNLCTDTLTVSFPFFPPLTWRILRKEEKIYFVLLLSAVKLKRKNDGVGKSFVRSKQLVMSASQ